MPPRVPKSVPKWFPDLFGFIESKEKKRDSKKALGITSELIEIYWDKFHTMMEKQRQKEAKPKAKPDPVKNLSKAMQKVEKDLQGCESMDDLMAIQEKIKQHIPDSFKPVLQQALNLDNSGEIELLNVVQDKLGNVQKEAQHVMVDLAQIGANSQLSPELSSQLQTVNLKMASVVNELVCIKGAAEQVLKDQNNADANNIHNAHDSDATENEDQEEDEKDPDAQSHQQQTERKNRKHRDFSTTPDTDEDDDGGDDNEKGLDEEEHDQIQLQQQDQVMQEATADGTF